MELSEAEQILGVTRDAPDSRVKAAYRTQARKHHPDQSDDPDAVEEFQKIHTAKRCLLESDGTQHSPQQPQQAQHQTQQRREKDPSTTSSQGEPTEQTGFRTRSRPGANNTETATSNDVHHISRDVWTGLSLTELAIALRHHIVPYLSSFRADAKRSPTVVGGVLIAYLGITTLDTAVPIPVQLGIVLLAQLAYSRYIIRNPVPFDAIREGLGFDEYEYSDHLREYPQVRGYLPIIVCGAVIYVLHSVFQASVGGIIPILSVVLVWALFTAILAGILSATLAYVYRPIYLGSVTVFSALVTFVLGFTTWGSPALFGGSEMMYLVGGPLIIAGIDIGLLFNISLSGILVYSTIGFFLYSSERVTRVVHTDKQQGASTWGILWLSLPALPATIGIWVADNPSLAAAVGAHVDLAVFASLGVAGPGITFALYMMRREIERMRLEGEPVRIRDLFRVFP
jgi:hypothetical protein